MTVKCGTAGCRNRITPPHEHNNWDLWCDECHRAARGPKVAKGGYWKGLKLHRNFQLRTARAGHSRRAGQA
jgi:hypothetical protein